jgi:hypothetical protein
MVKWLKVINLTKVGLNLNSNLLYFKADTVHNIAFPLSTKYNVFTRMCTKRKLVFKNILKQLPSALNFYEHE